MTDHRIVWVTLPRSLRRRNNADGTWYDARLTVLAMPVLSPSAETTLSSFPVLSDWIRHRPTSFFAGINGVGDQCVPDDDAPYRGPDYTEELPDSTQRADFPGRSDVWHALFPPTTPVRPAQVRDLTQLEYHTSYGALLDTALHHSLRSLAATVTDRGPTLGELRADPGFGPLVPDPLAPPQVLPPPGPDVAVDVSSTNPLDWTPILPRLSQIPDVNAQLTNAVRSTQGFYASSADDEAEELPDLEPPELDFHAYLTFFSQHAPLLRLLGLAYDLRLDNISPDVADGAPLDVGAIPHWDPAVTPSPPTSVSVATVCALDRRTEEFWAVPAPDRYFNQPADQSDEPGTETHRGFLRLGDADRFRVSSLDTDAAAGKLGGLAAVANKPADEEVDLPALSSGGITIARINRSVAAAEAAARRKRYHAAIVASPGPVLTDDAGELMRFYEEDVRRGLRFDVRFAARSEGPSPWYSLQERTGKYLIDGLSDPVPVDHDESMLGGQATLDRNADGSPAAVRVPEALASFTGWSLAVPRPGRWIDPDQNVVDDSERPDPDTIAGDERLGYRFTVPPGSIPPLRTGMRYDLRVRTVDLAGNSRAKDDSVEPSRAASVVASVTHRRYEPVNPPEVLLAAPRQEGESTDVVVLRSRGDGDVSGTDANRRYLAPPSVDQRSAEYDGAFDAGTGGIDPSAYDQIVELDAGSLSGAPPGGRPPHPEARPDPKRRVSADPDAADEPVAFWYEPEGERLAVNWIVDPAARGIAVKYLHRVESFTQLVGSSWALGGMELRVDPVAYPGDVAAGTASVNTSSPHLFVVALEEGAVVDLVVSSMIGDDELGGQLVQRFALAQELANSGALNFPLLRHILRGQHPQVTPRRTIRVVHATRQPVLAPTGSLAIRGDRFDPGRLGETVHYLEGNSELHHRSTDSVDVMATWIDTIDDGPGSGPLRVVEFSDVHVHTEDIEPPSHTAVSRVAGVDLAFPHRMSDTRHRVVDYRMRATSAFTEFFRQRIDDVDLTDTSVTEMLANEDGDAVGVVPSSVRVFDPGPNGERYVPGVDFAIEGSGIRPLRNVGSGLSVTYVVPPVTRDAEESHAVSLVSTRRPEPPEIDFVVPLFDWDTRGFSTRRSERKGGKLRVYLHRPLGTSGAGELVGVAVEPQGDFPVQRSTVTQVAANPLYGTLGRQAPHNPVRGDVLSAVRSDGPYAVPGWEGAAAVDVESHVPHFDEEMDRYWIDVELDPGAAYFPFVRLALCNYQPDAITDQHISPVVLADFNQLAPDRTATIVRNVFPSDTVRVALTGYSYSTTQSVVLGVDQDDRFPIVTAHFEERIPEIDDETVGWRPVPGSRQMPSQFDRSEDSDGRTVWESQIAIPDRDNELRLVVEEFEILTTDINVESTDDLRPDDLNEPLEEVEEIIPDLLGPISNRISEVIDDVGQGRYDKLLAEATQTVSGADGFLEIGGVARIAIDGESVIPDEGGPPQPDESTLTVQQGGVVLTATTGGLLAHRGDEAVGMRLVHQDILSIPRFAPAP